ncbi:MAG: cytochrome c maturation protein CcmE [Rhodospirillaceae bacterium]|nr:cytochrome c maturation protein CcmE [Rhodospirillaceae bacterium]
MKRKTQRLYFILLGGLAVATGIALVLAAFEDSIVFFYSPSDLSQQTINPGQRIRIGGLVEAGSVIKDGDTVTFKVTDTAETLSISYRGILPDLFREGQGIVAEGALLASGVFQASDVLAKHDENYMPPEVADALKAAGEWRPSQDGAEDAETAAVETISTETQ